METISNALIGLDVLMPTSGLAYGLVQEAGAHNSFLLQPILEGLNVQSLTME